MTEQTKAKTGVKNNSQGAATKSATAKKTASKTPADKRTASKKPVTVTAAKKKSAVTADKKVISSAQKKVAAKGTATPASKSAVKKAAGIKKEPSKAGKAAPVKVWLKPTPEERYRMIETAAYFIAERNNFQGDPAAFWSAAESEISTLLGE